MQVYHYLSDASLTRVLSGLAALFAPEDQRQPRAEPLALGYTTGQMAFGTAALAHMPESSWHVMAMEPALSTLPMGVVDRLKTLIKVELRAVRTTGPRGDPAQLPPPRPEPRRELVAGMGGEGSGNKVIPVLATTGAGGWMADGWPDLEQTFLFPTLAAGWAHNEQGPGPRWVVWGRDCDACAAQVIPYQDKLAIASQVRLTGWGARVLELAINVIVADKLLGWYKDFGLDRPIVLRPRLMALAATVADHLAARGALEATMVDIPGPVVPIPVLKSLGVPASAQTGMGDMGVRIILSESLKSVKQVLDRRGLYLGGQKRGTQWIVPEESDWIDPRLLQHLEANGPVTRVPLSRLASADRVKHVQASRIADAATWRQLVAGGPATWVTPGLTELAAQMAPAAPPVAPRASQNTGPTAQASSTGPTASQAGSAARQTATPEATQRTAAGQPTARPQAPQATGQPSSPEAPASKASGVPNTVAPNTVVPNTVAQATQAPPASTTQPPVKPADSGVDPRVASCRWAKNGCKGVDQCVFASMPTLGCPLLPPRPTTGAAETATPRAPEAVVSPPAQGPSQPETPPDQGRPVVQPPRDAHQAQPPVGSSLASPPPLPPPVSTPPIQVPPLATATGPVKPFQVPPPLDIPRGEVPVPPPVEIPRVEVPPPPRAVPPPLATGSVTPVSVPPVSVPPVSVPPPLATGSVTPVSVPPVSVPPVSLPPPLATATGSLTPVSVPPVSVPPVSVPPAESAESVPFYLRSSQKTPPPLTPPPLPPRAQVPPLPPLAPPPPPESPRDTLPPDLTPTLVTSRSALEASADQPWRAVEGPPTWSEPEALGPVAEEPLEPPTPAPPLRTLEWGAFQPSFLPDPESLEVLVDDHPVPKGTWSLERGANGALVVSFQPKARPRLGAIVQLHYRPRRGAV